MWDNRRAASPLRQDVRMVKEHRGSPEWDRIQAKLWCSLPSAELVSVQRVENHKLWRAFEAPLTEYRDAGGHVRHHASGVKEVCALKLLAACNCITRQYHNTKEIVSL